MTPPTIEAGDLEAETLSREEQQRAERRREEWLTAVKSLDTLPDTADVAPSSRRRESREIQVTLRLSAEYATLRELKELGFEDIVVKEAGCSRVLVKATYPEQSPEQVCN